MHTIDTSQTDQFRRIRCDQFLQPRELFLAEQAPRWIFTIVKTLKRTPTRVIPNIDILRTPPQPRIQNGQGEIAIRHFPSTPFFGIRHRINGFRSRHQMMHNLKISLHVRRVLSQSIHRSDNDLLGPLNIIHSVIVIAWIDHIPVAHTLPPTRRTANRVLYHLVRIVRAGWIQGQFHIPDIILPDHHLKVIVLEMLIRAFRRLIPKLPLRSTT